MASLWGTPQTQGLLFNVGVGVMPTKLSVNRAGANSTGNYPYTSVVDGKTVTWKLKASYSVFTVATNTLDSVRFRINDADARNVVYTNNPGMVNGSVGNTYTATFDVAGANGTASIGSDFIGNDELSYYFSGLTNGAFGSFHIATTQQLNTWAEGTASDGTKYKCDMSSSNSAGYVDFSM